jgi:hypothetical protein
MGHGSGARVEPLAWGGWAEAYRLSNGEAELVVVPAVSRVLRYGLVGGANVLWQNPAVAGRAPVREQWTNYGGSKTWIWPEHEWPTRAGSAWPPPTDLPDTIASTVEVRGATLRLATAPHPGFGLALLRELRLADSGTRVEIRSELRRHGGDEFPVAAWTVTQVPADGALFARLVTGSRLADGYKACFGRFAAVTREGEREGEDVLVVERQGAEYAKIGMDADLLAWQRDDLLFVERSRDRETPLAAFAPGDRAQVYSHFDGDPNLPEGVSYVELEHTSPMRAPLVGEGVSLETTWELVPLGRGERSRSAVAARLRATGR